MVVSLSRVAEIEIVLGVGGLTESVDVVGESPVVDVASSATDNALSQDMLFNLPIRPDNAATDLLNFVPGINNGVAYGGNSDYGNGLLIDGVDTRDPEAGSSWVFFNFNLVDEVQVGGLGAPAEYGAYTGAVVNTIMKSGGNRYTGLFDAYWTTTDFSADNVKPEYVEQNPTLKDPFIVNKRLDLTAQLGGPIVKDKLFFFLAAQRYEQEDDPSGPRTLHTELSPRVNAKLTWQPGPNDNLSATFQWDYYNQKGRTSITAAVNGDDQTRNQDSPEAVWGLQWRHLFGTRTFAEVKYSGWWGYYYLDPKVLVPLSFDGSTNEYSGGSLSYGYYADRGRHQVNASVSHYAEAFGKHDLKFGVEIERSKVRSQWGYNQGIYYYDYTDYYPKGQYYAYTYNYDTDGRNQRESLFAQDSWKPTERLTINAGVRVDFIRGRSPVLDKTVYSNTNWAPRLGFAFDLTGDGKTVLKGHYGQYYEGIFSAMYNRAMPGFQDFITYLYDPEGEMCGPLGNCFTEVDRLPYPVYDVDPDIKHPRVDEWTAGLERELTKDVRLSVTGIWRQDKNIQGSVYPDARWTAHDRDRGPRGPRSLAQRQGDRRLQLGESQRLGAHGDAHESRGVPVQGSIGPGARHRPHRPQVQGPDARSRQALLEPVAGSRLLRLVEGRGLLQQLGLAARHLRSGHPLRDADARPRQQLRPAGDRSHTRAQGLRHVPDPEDRRGPQCVLPVPHRLDLHALPAVPLTGHRLPALVGAFAPPRATGRPPYGQRELPRPADREELQPGWDQPARRLRRRPERLQRRDGHLHAGPLPPALGLRPGDVGRHPLRGPVADLRSAPAHARRALELLMHRTQPAR